MLGQCRVGTVDRVGTASCWDSGVLGQCRVGTVACWDSGVLGQCRVGTVPCWDSVLCAKFFLSSLGS